jgi:ABC-type multidrug transport system ATPase subunit
MQSISTASAISIEVKNLSKSFGPQSKPAVADLNFALRPGEAVAV